MSCINSKLNKKMCIADSIIGRIENRKKVIKWAKLIR